MVALISALDGIRDFDLKDHLPVYPLEQVGPLFWLSFIASWTVCYLVHLPSDTRLFRQALWPVSVGAFVWAVITVDMRGRDASFMLIGLFLFNATSAAVRWGRVTSPPIYRPLKRKPFFPLLRETNAFRAFNLLCDEPRLISLSAGSPGCPSSMTTAKRPDHGALYELGRHLLRGTRTWVLIDVSSYPLYHLDPSNLGNPLVAYSDWDLGIQTISQSLGVPRWVTIPAVVMSYATTTYLMMSFSCRLASILGIASGMWSAEEFPEMMDRPWVSSSLNELWGRRYHQILKHGFQNYARPLSFLPRSTYILRIFALSAIYHMLVYRPFFHTFIARDMTAMFMLSGLGLEMERQYLRRTGKKVGGWTGRVWTWSWFILCGYFMCRGLAAIGFVGGAREMLAVDRTGSAVEWALYGLGRRPHPSLPLPSPRIFGM